MQENRRLVPSYTASCRNLPKFIPNRLLMIETGKALGPIISEVMLKRLRLLTIAAACCGLASGCARTSDGSVVLAKPLAMPGFAGRTQEPVYEAVPSQLLPPPPVERTPRPVHASASANSNAGSGVQGWKPSVKPPFVRSDPSRPLSCRNETSTTGRIKMVCR